MRLRLLLGALFLSALAYATDYTSPAKTANDQTYNRGWRDLGNGQNAVTGDVVTANVFAQTTGITNTIKATSGYIDNFTLNTLCVGSYVLADAAAGAASYATVISTIGVTTVGAAAIGPVNIPVKVRTTNGIAFSVPAATCTVTVSYR